VIVPALVDIHVHGVKGFDVMDGRANDVIRELREIGIEWCCPTTVTASDADIRTALAAIDPSAPGFAGVHLEGPFISPDKPGAQPVDAIREPTVEAFQKCVGEFADLIRIVTLAPELPGAVSLIEYLHGKGLIVSAGHTNATYEQLSSVKVDHMTHFYNAMTPLGHRKPGAVGYGLTQNVLCELIYDRIHVSRPGAEILIRAKGPERVIGVSDGTTASGMPDGWSGGMWGNRVVKGSGAVRLEDGTLAGSAVTLIDVFKNLWQDFGPETAIAACSTVPRRSLGLPEPAMWLRVDDSGTIIEVLHHV
jgi:N-acetylglucosamine-6-phosphate deacetylase